MIGLDLFSGIGGLTIALAPWVRPIAYCENDKYCQGVLLSRMSRRELPMAPIWDDVRTLRYFQPRVDIIYGGFPCQDISVAGRRKGLEGERSGLFFEIARLVGEIRPSFVFLENVPNIRTLGASVVVGELASLGYDARWAVLSAYDVGAPHIRERWWLLAHAQGKQNRGIQSPGFQPNIRAGGQVMAYPKSLSKRKQANQTDPEPAVGETRDEFINGRPFVANAESPISKSNWPLSDGQQGGFANSGWWATEPNVGRVAHGIPARVDRLRGLGNAVVPAQAREAFERLMGFKK